MIEVRRKGKEREKAGRGGGGSVRIKKTYGERVDKAVDNQEEKDRSLLHLRSEGGRILHMT